MHSDILNNLIGKKDIFDSFRKRWKIGCGFLNSKYPFMGGAMSWISDSNLVSSISNNGGFGVLAAGSMLPDILHAEIKKTQKLTNRSFGVNLITLHPKIEELIDVCIDLKITHIVLGGSLPKASSLKKIKDSNIKLICFAPNLLLAKRMVKNGADALIIEGSEAGGHIGSVSTSILAQEVLGKIDVPVFVAGGVGSGKIILHYMLMGACGCQMGTVFVCANESIAHEKFKKIFLKSNSRDAVISTQIDPDFPVIPVRAIQNKATVAFINIQREVIKKFNAGELNKQEAQIEIEKFWVGALRRAVIEGDVDHGSVMAGQSVGMIKEIKSTKNIIDDLLQEILLLWQ